MTTENKESVNSKDNKNLLIYLEDISKYPVLNKDEELELVRRAQNGDVEARNELINRNLQIVARVAGYYVDNGMEYMDLIQEGNIILMNLIDKYDFRSGRTFNYFLRWHLYNDYVKLFERIGNRNVKISLNNKWINICTAIKKLHIEPNDRKELYKILEGIFPNEPNLVERAYLFIEDTYSLEDMLTDAEYPPIDEQTRGHNHYSVEDEVIRKNILNEIHSIIENIDFTDTQRKVIYLHTGFDGNAPLNFPQIAKLFNITPAGVCNVFRSALVKIRISPEYLKLAKLASYLYMSEESVQKKSRDYQEHFRTFAGTKRPKRGVTMVDIFPSTRSKKKVKHIIPKLTEDEQELVMKFCNGDVSHEIRADLTLDESLLLHTSILPKMSDMLEEPNVKVYQKQ